MDAKHVLDGPTLFIAEDAIEHNLALLRRWVGQRVQTCAVVKADAYGHGAQLLASVLSRPRTGARGMLADSLAVASFEEAYALGPSPLPVLVLRPIEYHLVGGQRQAIAMAIHRDWVVTVCSVLAAEDVARIAKQEQKRANVHLLVDTGMARCGVAPDDVGTIVAAIDEHPELLLASMSTHFACSEVRGHGFTEEQLRIFLAATDPIVRCRDTPVVRHAANSGAVFTTPESHLDMIRPGIALYGIDPSGEYSDLRPLRPAMRWEAPIIAIHTLETGQSVGYGQSWRAPRPTRVGVLSVGYADGYPRYYSDKAGMLCNGKYCPVIGRVSMDMACIDLTPASEIEVGDAAVVMDDDPNSPISVYALAEMAQTIPYEVIARIGTRVRRRAVAATFSGASLSLGEEVA